MAETQEPYPEGDVVGPCICGSWPGGKCLKCPRIALQEDAFEGWVKIDELREHFDSVNCGTIYKHGGEGRVLLRAAPPKRQWVGLKDEDMNDPRTQNFDFIYGARWAESKLKERNNG